MNDSAKSDGTNGVGHGCAADPKWAALVDDRLIPMPRRKISAAVIYEQACISDGQSLFRDHESPHDPVIPANAEVDLGDGNVFYSAPICQTRERPACKAPAKLAFIVDDAWEEVITPNQTGRMLRDLFDLPAETELLRDYESPHDQPIADDAPAFFGGGPVFRTRAIALVTITIDGTEFRVRAGKHVVAELRTLGNVQKDWDFCQMVEGQPPKPLKDTDIVDIKGGEAFASHQPSGGAS